jgi:hypothetical protein
MMKATDAFSEDSKYDSLVILNDLIAPLYSQRVCATISTREKEFRTGSLSDFYPTFRAVCVSSSSKFKNQIKSAEIPLLEYETVSFIRKEVDQCEHLTSAAKICLSVQKLRVCSKIQSEVRSTLLTTHILGDCIKDNKHSIDKACYACKAWQLFKLSIRYTERSDVYNLNGIELYHYSVLSRTLKLLNDTPYEDLTPQPFKWINIFSGSTYSEVKYEKLAIPTVASKKLFEIQCWIFFVFLLVRFEHIATNDETKKPSTLISLRESLEYRIGKEDELSLPYYIDTSGHDLVHVHIPSFVLNLKQTMSKVGLKRPYFT